MVNRGIDEVREIVGGIEERDCFRTERITVERKKEKFMWLLSKYSLDMQNIVFKENVILLVDGKNKLILIDVPESQRMSKYLTEAFRDSKYIGTKRRKDDIRRKILESITGRSGCGELENQIDNIYEIIVQADFNRGG